MHYKKTLVLLALCLVLGFVGCSKEESKVVAPTQEQITKNLVPAKAEVKGQNFSAEISDLKVAMTVNIASKEIVETPQLTGNIKITNNSKNIMDVQAATLEYVNEAGKSIAFQSGEKIATVSPSWLKIIQPGEVIEGSIEATIPREATKKNTLRGIKINLVYVSTPLSRETFTVPQKIE